MRRVTVRLPSQKRREIILQSARSLFTEKGLDRTTTKDLAKAAGISEALLFRHFPTKEALYAAVLRSCCEAEEGGPMQRIQRLEPSTSSLVFLVYFFYCRMALSPRHAEGTASHTMPKLILQSLAGDGEFARRCHERGAALIVAKMEQCLAAATAAGDVVAAPDRRNVRCWLAQHLAGMLAFHHLHDPPIVHYGISRQELGEQAVWFALRGLGLKDEAIRKHFNPAALALLAG